MLHVHDLESLSWLFQGSLREQELRNERLSVKLQQRPEADDVRAMQQQLSSLHVVMEQTSSEHEQQLERLHVQLGDMQADRDRLSQQLNGAGKEEEDGQQAAAAQDLKRCVCVDWDCLSQDHSPTFLYKDHLVMLQCLYISWWPRGVIKGVSTRRRWGEGMQLLYSLYRGRNAKNNVSGFLIRMQQRVDALPPSYLAIQIRYHFALCTRCMPSPRLWRQRVYKPLVAGFKLVCMYVHF